VSMPALSQSQPDASAPAGLVTRGAGWVRGRLVPSLRAVVDNFQLALRTFWGHRLRSALTLLGIVIGVATVVSMMALLEGLQRRVNADLAGLGANGFQLQKWPAGFGHFDNDKINRRPNVSFADYEAIQKHVPDVAKVTAEAYEGAKKFSTASRETRPGVQLAGGTQYYLDTNAMELAKGRPFSETEVQDAAQVVIIGPDIADVLFPDIDPIGQVVRLTGRSFEVIGVMTRKGGFAGPGYDNTGIIPISVFFELFGRNRSLNISMQAWDTAVLQRAQDSVELLMRHRHNLRPDQESDFTIYSNESATATFNQISSVVMAASFGVCLLSLVVGGIGILNIMLVSVTERTHEIGVRKALGARRHRILAQFATEAVVLSLLGGLVGVGLGFFTAFLARWALGFPTAVPPWAVALALAMSSSVGLVFGIYPASRAANLDPVEAMRSE
jgi:putative ABC transport system permease protein